MVVTAQDSNNIVLVVSRRGANILSELLVGFKSGPLPTMCNIVEGSTPDESETRATAVQAAVTIAGALQETQGIHISGASATVQ